MTSRKNRKRGLVALTVLVLAAVVVVVWHRGDAQTAAQDASLLPTPVTRCAGAPSPCSKEYPHALICPHAYSQGTTIIRPGLWAQVWDGASESTHVTDHWGRCYSHQVWYHLLITKFGWTQAEIQAAENGAGLSP